MRSAISPRLAMRIFSNMLAAISMTKSGWPNSTGWPFSTRIALIVPAASASISFISFIASMMQSVSPSLTALPTSTKGCASGRRRAVEGADHRRLDDVALLAGRRLGGGRRGSGAGVPAAAPAGGGERSRGGAAAASGVTLTAPPRAMRTFSSPSVISSSAIPIPGPGRSAS